MSEKMHEELKPWNHKAYKNPDKEIFRERPIPNYDREGGDNAGYEPTVLVDENNDAITMCAGGRCRKMPIQKWLESKDVDAQVAAAKREVVDGIITYIIEHRFDVMDFGDKCVVEESHLRKHLCSLITKEDK